MSRMIRNHALIGLLALAACGAQAEPAAPVAPPVPVRAQEPPKAAQPPAAPFASGRVASAVAGKVSKTVRASVGVWDAKTGDTLHETNGATPRRPASVMKIPTTAAALLALGASAELATGIYATAKAGPEGCLDGD